MKKLISVILLVTLSLFANISLVSATSTTPKFSVTSASGKCGDSVYVSINIENNPGITALQLNINYSASDLELVSIEDNKLFSDSITYSQINRNPFVISWFSSNSKNITNSGKVATLEFKILDGAETSDISISYDADNVFDSSFNNINFGTSSGRITVNKPISGDVNKDGSVTIQDATVLQQYLANIVNFDDEQLSVADTNGDGNISIADATQIQKYLANIITSLG